MTMIFPPSNITLQKQIILSADCLNQFSFSFPNWVTVSINHMTLSISVSQLILREPQSNPFTVFWQNAAIFASWCCDKKKNWRGTHNSERCISAASTYRKLVCYMIYSSLHSFISRVYSLSCSREFCVNGERATKLVFIKNLIRETGRTLTLLLM